MRDFSTVDLVTKLDLVKTAALKEPVGITQHRKRKFVMLAADDYERLRGTQNPHRAYLAEETPEDVAELLREDLAALDDDGLR